ncbi:MAG: hypothetical protein ACM3SV_10830 [Betaproteobacteria bacterium]
MHASPTTGVDRYGCVGPRLGPHVILIVSPEIFSAFKDYAPNARQANAGLPEPHSQQSRKFLVGCFANLHHASFHAPSAFHQAAGRTHFSIAPIGARAFILQIFHSILLRASPALPPARGQNEN